MRESRVRCDEMRHSTTRRDATRRVDERADKRADKQSVTSRVTPSQHTRRPPPRTLGADSARLTPPSRPRPRAPHAAAFRQGAACPEPHAVPPFPFLRLLPAFLPAGRPGRPRLRASSSLTRTTRATVYQACCSPSCCCARGQGLQCPPRPPRYAMRVAVMALAALLLLLWLDGSCDG
jgi:hypothetical protein